MHFLHCWARILGSRRLRGSYWVRSIRSDNIADKVFKKNSRTPWALNLTEKLIRAKLFRNRWFQCIMKMTRCKAFFVSLHLKIDFLCNKSWVASKTYFHWLNCPFYLLLVKLSFNNNEATLTSMETSLQWRLNWCGDPPKDNSKTNDLPAPTPNNVEL